MDATAFLVRCLTHFSRDKDSVFHFPTRNFFQDFFGLEGSKRFLEKHHQVHNLKISDRLLRSKSRKIFLVLYAAYFVVREEGRGWGGVGKR